MLLLLCSSLCLARHTVPGLADAHTEGLLDRVGHSIRRILQQATSGAPTSFPQPEVAAASPYTDNQQMVLDTTASPFSAIGQILISTTGQDGTSGWCTGSLVSQRDWKALTMP